METKIKQGQYVILNNGEGMIGHGNICKVTKVKGSTVCLKAPFMHGQSHYFDIQKTLPLPSLSIKPVMRLTVEQNKWLSNYYDHTGFEPMHLDELELGTITFSKAARENIDWYEDHTSEIFLTITDEFGELE